MENAKFKVYHTELVNGSKGTIAIPVHSEFVDILNGKVFIEDEFSETAIRSDAVIKYEFIKYE